MPRGKKKAKSKAKTAAPQPSQPLFHPPSALLYDPSHDSFECIASYLTASDLGTCALLCTAWYQASNAVEVWKQHMVAWCPELADTVLPIAADHLANGGGGMWHPKNLLKQHWRVCDVDSGNGNDKKHADDDDTLETRKREEKQRWKARFRNCFLKIVLLDGNKPTHLAPFLTKLIPISDGKAMERFFSSAGLGGGLCLGTVPMSRDYSKGEEESLNVLEMLPDDIKAIVSLLDLSGTADPKEVKLCVAEKYEDICEYYPNPYPHVTCSFYPTNSQGCIKLPGPVGEAYAEYDHSLEVNARKIWKGGEDPYDPFEDQGHACRAAVAMAKPLSCHLHASLKISLWTQSDFIETYDENTFSDLDCWRWLDRALHGL